MTIKSSIVRVLFVSLFVSVILPTITHAATFNPGRIIDDGVMTNSSSMSVADIQNFLNSKLSSCDTNGSGLTGYYYDESTGMYGWRFTSKYVTTTRAVQGQRYDTFWRTHPDLKNQYNQNWRDGDATAPFTCLKDYRVGDGRTAAQVIYDSAQKWRINPQVFIVLLQKENGLITDDYPWPLQMRTATGYGCPDTAPCDSQYFGLANQLDWAGKLFRKVLDQDPNWYSPYVVGNNYVQWSPNGACGGSNVYIQNWSTAALYDYTPYQPNAAALNAGYGTGDNCSAYGNRNFFLYFNDWFGTTYTPDYSWQLITQSAYTDNSKSTPSSLSLISGQRSFMSITIKNTGNTTWTNTGSNPINIGTSNPYERTSVLYDSTWLSKTRPATLKEASVAPGQVGTFEFWITAPFVTQPSTLNEYFNPLAESRVWFPNIGLFYRVTVQPPTYTWSMASQYAYTDMSKTTVANMNALLPGQRVLVGFTAKNTGNMTWYNSGPNAIMLGTAAPYERKSKFTDPSWITGTRPVIMKEASVAPGQVGTFEFWMSVPSTGALGIYNERFNLIANDLTWLNDVGLSYYVHVN